MARVTTAPIALPFLASPMQSWSPDGRLVAYLAEHAGATELWLWERATGRQRPLTRLGNHISSYSWAPDGASLLVASNQLGRYDIYRVALADGSAARLTDDARYEVAPVSTPDGARVLYVRLDEHWADHEVVSIAASGGDERVLATDQDFFDYHYGRTFGSPLVAPDGRMALFRSHRSGDDLRQMVLRVLDVAQDGQCVIDSLPVPVVQFHLVPSSTGDWDAHGAAFGRCETKKQTIYGYRLHLLITLGGAIVDFELTSANADDRDAARDTKDFDGEEQILAINQQLQAVEGSRLKI